MFSDHGSLPQLVLDCFEGDITILYHLCRKRDLDIRAVRLVSVCDQILESNQFFAQKASALAILAHILELKLLELLELKSEKSLVLDSLVEENSALLLRTNLAACVSKIINGLLASSEKSSVLAKAAALGDAKRLRNALLQVVKSKLEKFRRKSQFLSGLSVRLLNRLKNLAEFKQSLVRLISQHKQISLKKVAKTKAECLGFFLAALDLRKECDFEFKKVDNDILINSGQFSQKISKSLS